MAGAAAGIILPVAGHTRMELPHVFCGLPVRLPPYHYLPKYEESFVLIFNPNVFIFRHRVAHVGPEMLVER